MALAFEYRVRGTSGKEVGKGGLLVTQRLLERTQETTLSQVNSGCFLRAVNRALA